MTDQFPTGKEQDNLKRKQNDKNITKSTTKHTFNTSSITGTSNRTESSTMSSQDKQILVVRDLSKKVLKGLNISKRDKKDQVQITESTTTKKQKTNIRDTLTREYPFLPEKQITRIEDIQRQIAETHNTESFSHHDLHTSIQNGIKAISEIQEAMPDINNIEDTLKTKERELREVNQSLSELYQQYNQVKPITPYGQSIFTNNTLGIEESFDDPFSQNLEAELLCQRINIKIQDIDTINRQIFLYEQQISLYNQQTDNITQTQQKLKETLQTYQYWANDLQDRHLDLNKVSNTKHKDDLSTLSNTGIELDKETDSTSPRNQFYSNSNETENNTSPIEIELNNSLSTNPLIESTTKASTHKDITPPLLLSPKELQTIPANPIKKLKAYLDSVTGQSLTPKQDDIHNALLPLFEYCESRDKNDLTSCQWSHSDITGSLHTIQDYAQKYKHSNDPTWKALYQNGLSHILDYSNIPDQPTHLSSQNILSRLEEKEQPNINEQLTILQSLSTEADIIKLAYNTVQEKPSSTFRQFSNINNIDPLSIAKAKRRITNTDLYKKEASLSPNQQSKEYRTHKLALEILDTIKGNLQNGAAYQSTNINEQLIKLQKLSTEADVIKLAYNTVQEKPSSTFRQFSNTDNIDLLSITDAKKRITDTNLYKREVHLPPNQQSEKYKTYKLALKALDNIRSRLQNNINSLYISEKRNIVTTYTNKNKEKDTTQHKVKIIFDSIKLADFRTLVGSLNRSRRSDDDINRYNPKLKVMSQARNLLAEETTKLYNFIQGEECTDKELGDTIRNIYNHFSDAHITDTHMKNIYERIKTNPKVLLFGKSTQG
jgi:hypothetical protein